MRSGHEHNEAGGTTSPPASGKQPVSESETHRPSVQSQIGSKPQTSADRPPVTGVSTADKTW